MANYYINGYADQKTRVEVNRNLFPVKKENGIKQMLKIASQYGKSMREDDYGSAQDRCKELRRCAEDFKAEAGKYERLRFAMYVATTTNYDARKLLTDTLLNQMHFYIRKTDYLQIQEILASSKDKSLAIKIDKFFTKFCPEYKEYKAESSIRPAIKTM